MKVLLIGGGGFIGTWLARALCEAGHSVQIVGRSPLSEEKWAFLPKFGWSFREMDFRTALRRQDLLEADAIVPLVWTLGSVATAKDPMASLGDAENMLTLLHTLAELNCKPLIVFPSSHLVPKPMCLYSVHKMLVEHYLDFFWRVHGIPYIALRVGKAYGPLQRRGVVDFYIRRGLAEESIPVYGDGKDRIAFVYVGDAARGLRQAIEGRFLKNRVYNLVGHNSTMTDVAEAVAELVGGTVEHVPWPDLDKAVDAGDLPLGNDLVVWGWSPVCSLKEGIARTAEWITHGFPG